MIMAKSQLCFLTRSHLYVESQPARLRETEHRLLVARVWELGTGEKLVYRYTFLL